MEVHRVAKMGRPKSANPKNTLIGLKLTEEEATKWNIPKEAVYENSFLEKGEQWHIQGKIRKVGY